MTMATTTQRLRPMTDAERRGAGFCCCPQVRMPGLPGPRRQPEAAKPCPVHHDATHPSEQDRDRELLFYDRDRNRYVTWPDAAEAKRQRPHLKRPHDRDVQLMGWIRLVKLLRALRTPLDSSPADPVTEDQGAELIQWAGDNVDPALLRHVLWLTDDDDATASAMCRLFSVAARSARGEA